jgi:catechol 2,3-dioxygenase-like lactoylglutathione lyase family enzyme
MTADEKRTMPSAPARVTSCVVFVRELRRSVDFYRDIFSCEVAIQTPEDALLLAPGGFQIYLLAQGARAVHPSGGVGVQYVIWGVRAAAELADIQRALANRQGHYPTSIHTRDGITFLASRDPDGIRILVAHPCPQRLPRSVVDNYLHVEASCPQGNQLFHRQLAGGRQAPPRTFADG